MRIFIIIALICVIAACGSPRAADDKPGVPVDLAIVETVDASRTLWFAGITRAADRAVLRFLESGDVVARPVAVGDKVVVGDALATLSNPGLQPRVDGAAAEIAQLDATLARLRRDLIRLQGLEVASAVSDEQLDRVQTDIHTTTAQRQAVGARLAEAQQALERATLKAPFDGVVTRVYVEPGDVVDASSPVIEVAGDAVEVEITVPADTASELSRGESAFVRAPLYPERTFIGTIVELANEAAPQRGLFPLVVQLAQTDGLRPGRTVEVGLNEPSLPSLAVPIGAIQASAQGPRVFVAQDDGRVRTVPVSIVRYQAKYALVQGALSAGQQVVAVGAATMLDGDRIR